MPQYECRTVSLSKLIVSERGLHEPLCNSCACPDCENPIETKMVSVFGINKPYRVMVRNGDPFCVISCPEGYISQSEMDQEEESAEEV